MYEEYCPRSRYQGQIQATTPRIVSAGVSVGCNYLSPPLIPASGTKDLMCLSELQIIIVSCNCLSAHSACNRHWGRTTHICVSKLAVIASDNGLSSGRRQAIIWNNAGILSIGFLGTNFSEILIEILTFSFTKMRLKMSSVKWRPFCHDLNVLTSHYQIYGWLIVNWT